MNRMLDSNRKGRKVKTGGRGDDYVQTIVKRQLLEIGSKRLCNPDLLEFTSSEH